MFDDAVRNNPAILYLVPDRFKTQEICMKAVEAGLFKLDNVSDYLRTQAVCIKTVEEDP